jgi:hypothetical protein
MMQQQRAELERFHHDTAYLQGHWDELLHQYPEQWIAIFNRAVVGAAPEFDQLLTELQKKGIPMGKARIERMTRGDDLLILPS